jgi:hypothetical protein
MRQKPRHAPENPPMLTLFYTVVILVVLFFGLGAVSSLSAKLNPDKSLVKIEHAFRIRHPRSARAVNSLLLVVVPLGSLMLAYHFANAPSTVGQDGSSHGAGTLVTGQVAIVSAREPDLAKDAGHRERHETIASDVDDVVRTLGYSAHIFPGSEGQNLVVVSDALSGGQDRDLFLSLLRGKWKQELCSAGYATVTFKSGVLSAGITYPLFC